MDWRGRVSRKRATFVFACLAAAALGTSASFAQTADCAGLQAQIAAIRPDAAASQRYLEQAQRLQRDLDRSASYAHSIGCDNRQFLFFGSAPPPQCQQLTPQIQRMQANLQQLQQRAAAASGDGQRRALTARYDASCRPGARPSGPRSFFEQLFGTDDSTAPPTSEPIEAPPAPAEPTGPSGGSKAVCVRACDGGFFPISYTASRADYSDLQAQCTALCPNVPTTLYTFPESGDIDQALSADGKPYSALPKADAFRKTYDPECTCRPPHESWADALANAEQLSHTQKSDIIVTPEKSDQMARATAPKPVKPGAKKSKTEPVPPSQAAAGTTADDQTAVDEANSAAGPTVGQDSADIGSTAAISGKTYGATDGKVVEETGPDGVKRRVRIIGP